MVCSPPSLHFHVVILDQEVDQEENDKHSDCHQHTHSCAHGRIPEGVALGAEGDVVHVNKGRSGAQLAGQRRTPHLAPNEEAHNTDGPEGQAGFEHATKQGQSDAGELLDLAGAVDSGSLIHVRRKTLNATHENEHVVTHRTEAEGHQQRPELDRTAHVVGLGQIGIEQRKEVVQKSEPFVEDSGDPHGGHSYRIDDVGNIDDRFIEGLACKAVGEDRRKQQRDQHDSNAAVYPNLQHVLHRVQENRGLQQGSIVFQADELPGIERVADAFHLEKAHGNRTQNRVQEDQHKHEQCRRQKAYDHFFVFFLTESI